MDFFVGIKIVIIVRKTQMKKLFVLLVIFVGHYTQAQIQFKPSIKEAQTHAKLAGKKYILIDFTATWCGPCKQMDKKVFAKPDVGNFVNAKFSPAKIDIDTPEGKELTSKYVIESIPTIIVTDLNGKVIKRLEGFHADKEFLKQLETM